MTSGSFHRRERMSDEQPRLQWLESRWLPWVFIGAFVLLVVAGVASLIL